MIEKERKVIDLMKNIILLKNAWLKMSRRMRTKILMWLKHELHDSILIFNHTIFNKIILHANSNFFF